MYRTELLEMLHQGLNDMDQSLDRQTEGKLIQYIELIGKFNTVYKLTNIRDLDTMVTRHLLDSLSIRDFIEGKNILDVGTGAGLPGIPLAITMPDRQFVLLDSNQKKTRFLQQISYQMRLRNVRIVNCRVEEHLADPLFDTVISRSFSTLSDFLNQSRHLVKPDGQILAMKGIYPFTELQEVSAHFKLVEVQPLKVPQLNAERHVVNLIYQPETITA